VLSISTPPSGSSTTAIASKTRDWNEREHMKLATSSVGNKQKDTNIVARGKVSKGEDNKSNEDTKNNNRYLDERERRRVAASMAGSSLQLNADGDHNIMKNNRKPAAVPTKTRDWDERQRQKLAMNAPIGLSTGINRSLKKHQLKNMIWLRLNLTIRL
jgi:hypothetical protein